MNSTKVRTRVQVSIASVCCKCLFRVSIVSVYCECLTVSIVSAHCKCPLRVPIVSIVSVCCKCLLRLSIVSVYCKCLLCLRSKVVKDQLFSYVFALKCCNTMWFALFRSEMMQKHWLYCLFAPKWYFVNMLFIMCSLPHVQKILQKMIRIVVVRISQTHIFTVAMFCLTKNNTHVWTFIEKP